MRTLTFNPVPSFLGLVIKFGGSGARLLLRAAFAIRSWENTPLRTEQKTDGSVTATSFTRGAQWPVFYLAICLSGGLLGAGLGSAATAAATAMPARAAAADDAGKMTFEANCSVCHGEDGSGDTPIGMSLMIPDLRSDDVQKLSDAELIAIVTNGKDPMPSFKDKLSADEIKGVIAYVRTFAKKK